MGCHALLQGIFPTRGLKPGLPHCTQILYHLKHQGNDINQYPSGMIWWGSVSGKRSLKARSPINQLFFNKSLKIKQTNKKNPESFPNPKKLLHKCRREKKVDYWICLELKCDMYQRKCIKRLQRDKKKFCPLIQPWRYYPLHICSQVRGLHSAICHKWHWLNGHEFEQILGDSKGQRSLACCSPWDRKESSSAEQLNKNNKFCGLS